MKTMKKLGMVLALGCAVLMALASCSIDDEDHRYELRITGTATPVDGEPFPVDWHYTSTDGNTVSGDEIARLLEIHKSEEAIAEIEIVNLFRWQSCHVFITGFVTEKATGLKVNIKRYLSVCEEDLDEDKGRKKTNESKEIY